MKFLKSEPAAEQVSVHGNNPSAAVLEQLRLIQDSQPFCNSPRSKEFLSYVVEHGLDGHDELLKERSIGVNLFHRNPTYITGDDPIVRVKAAEVRRRLSQYYAGVEEAPEVRIEIPVGSYVPKFHWKGPAPSAPLTLAEIPVVQKDGPQPSLHRWKTWIAVALMAGLGIATTIAVRRHAQRKSPLEAFWAPTLTSGQPVLICLATPITYAVNSALYAMPTQGGTGKFDSEVARSSVPPQLPPETSLKWKDLTPLIDYSVNKDDAYAAADLAALFARIHKSSQVRIGRDFTYEDLRSSPAVLIGAFDNPWTMRVDAELPIFFREPGDIVERGNQGRVWRMEGDKRGTKDFAVVARLLNSKTGQFLVIVAGIGMVGTQGAGNVVSDQDELGAALRTIPNDWQTKNLELVLESDVIDGSASPTRVVAVKTW